MRIRSTVQKEGRGHRFTYITFHLTKTHKYIIAEIIEVWLHISSQWDMAIGKIQQCCNNVTKLSLILCLLTSIIVSSKAVSSKAVSDREFKVPTYAQKSPKLYFLTKNSQFSQNYVLLKSRSCLGRIETLIMKPFSFRIDLSDWAILCQLSYTTYFLFI